MHTSSRNHFWRKNASLKFSHSVTHMYSTPLRSLGEKRILGHYTLSVVVVMVTKVQCILLRVEVLVIKIIVYP